MKKTLSELGKLQIVDYEKEFLLRTDASNIGMGAVLLKKNNKDKWFPVQWASKNVFWTVKKFEYELRGRKFEIETDQKTLAEIRNKLDFENARINRWVEKIQEFDFEIDYRRPEEMVVADCLSRICTSEESERKKMIESRETNK
jgi:hypothetical protein